MHTIESLNGRTAERAYENASTKIRRIFYELERPEFMDSLSAFCKKYHISYSGVVIDIYANSYIETDLTDILRETFEVRKSLADDIRSTYKDETDGQCSLTGIDHDCLFFDYFLTHGPPTAEDLPLELDKAVAFAVEKFTTMWRDNSIKREYIREFIEAYDITFDDDGEIIERK